MGKLWTKLDKDQIYKKIESSWSYFPVIPAFREIIKTMEWRMAILSLGLLQFLAAVYDMRFPHPESQ